LFEYKAEDGEGVNKSAPSEQHRWAPGVTPPTAQRYLKRIRYGNRHDVSPADSEFHFQVVFDYGEHFRDATGQFDVTLTEDETWAVRPDPTSSYRSGFELRTYRR